MPATTAKCAATAAAAADVFNVSVSNLSKRQNQTS
jgi:hypothetical protein